jgi:hypothetical protein
VNEPPEDDFFEGDDVWEDVDADGSTHVLEAPRGLRDRGGGFKRGPRDPVAMRRRLVAGGAALAVLVAIVLVVVLSSSGGSSPPATESTVTPPTVTAPATQPATTAAAPATTAAQIPRNFRVRVAGGATLKTGDSGPAVRDLQLALRFLGHAPGKVDGNYGAATAAAVAAFQREAGLPADGVVGPATLRAINLALQRRG